MNHFERRRRERDVSDEEIAYALTGKALRQPQGRTLFYRGRVGVVLGKHGERITVLRYTKAAVKRKLSW